jgi:hypothetical protein
MCRALLEKMLEMPQRALERVTGGRSFGTSHSIQLYCLLPA